MSVSAKKSPARAAICCRKGTPSRAQNWALCLTLGNELSEETHVLTKQEILLGKGTRKPLCILEGEGEGEVAQSCPTLCDPVDCNLLGFSVHGILQARILEWIAISFSRGSSRPRDRTRVSRIGGRRFFLAPL